MSKIPAAGLAALVACLAPLPAAAAPRPFVVITHIASAQPKQARAWLDAQLARANAHFAAAGVAFSVGSRRTLPASFNTVGSIRERLRLRRFFVPRVINIMVADRVLDPHPSRSTRRAARRMGFSPSGELAGAHILTRRKTNPATFILVARGSDALTLTHELGHFFWCPHHRDSDNIMSYGHARHSFDARQLRAIRTWARRYRRRGLRRASAAR